MGLRIRLTGDESDRLIINSKSFSHARLSLATMPAGMSAAWRLLAEGHIRTILHEHGSISQLSDAAHY
jgi:hypothetical protein